MDEENEKLSGDRKMSLKEILRHSKPYILKEKWALLLSFLLILINVGTSIALPLFTARFVDLLKGDIQSTTLQIVLGVVLGYAAIGIADQVLLYFQSMILQKAGQRIVYRLRMEVFTHIESMSLNQFNQMPVGSLGIVNNYPVKMRTHNPDFVSVFSRGKRKRGTHHSRSDNGNNSHESSDYCPLNKKAPV